LIEPSLVEKSTAWTLKVDAVMPEIHVKLKRFLLQDLTSPGVALFPQILPEIHSHSFT